MNRTTRPDCTLPRWNSTGLLVALTVALGAWVLESSQLSRPFDSLAYDACVQIKRHLREVPARVLLTYVDRRDLIRDPETVTLLSQKLEELGVRHQALTFSLDEVSGPLRERSIAGKLVLSMESSRSENVETTPFGNTSETTMGTVSVIPPHHGVYRYHFGERRLRGAVVRSVAAQLASQVILDSASLPKGTYLVNFRGGPGSLPHVDTDQVLSGSLVRELTEGKVALIGLKSEPTFPGVATPTTSGTEAMSLLEFHGHALNTMLTDSVMSTVNPMAKLTIFLIVAVTSSLMSQRLGLRWSLPLVAVLVSMTSVLSLLLLTYLCVWIPWFALVAIQVFCCGLIFGMRFRLSDRAVSSMASDQWSRIRRRRWPSDLFSAEELWEQLVSFAYQMFYLDRLVILELLPGKDSMQVVKQVNCDEEDISERRRDSRRWPFLAAVDVKGPMRLDDSGRWFFKPSGGEHNQFLVPLLFGGELYGYLALEVATSYLAKFEDFIPRLQEFSDEVAGLLYRRRCVQAESEDNSSRKRLLNYVPEQTVLSELRQASVLLERRLARLEDVFDNSATAAAVFDVFGQPLLMNTRLLSVLQRKGLVSSNTTAVDLLVALTNRDLNYCRRRLRQVIIEKRTCTITVSLDDSPGVFDLHIRPLQLDSSSLSTAVGEAEPFQLQGIHCELVDGTSFLEMHSLKDRVAEHLCGVLTHDLDEVTQVAAQFASESVPPSDYRQYGSMIKEHLDGAVETLRECQSFLSRDLYSYPGDGVPVDPQSALREALDATRDVFSARNLNPRINASKPLGEVLANPKRLQEVFETLLEILAGDSFSNSEISIGMKKGVNDVICSLANHGKGDSFERLRESLSEDADANASSRESRLLREIRDWIEHWGGRMMISAEAGKGLSIELILKAYHLRTFTDEETRGNTFPTAART